MPMQKSYKIVVVGDGAVGKTCLLMSFVQKKKPEMMDEYIPTVFDNRTTTLEIENETVRILYKRQFIHKHLRHCLKKRFLISLMQPYATPF